MYVCIKLYYTHYQYHTLTPYNLHLKPPAWKEVHSSTQNSEFDRTLHCETFSIQSGLKFHILKWDSFVHFTLPVTTVTATEVRRFVLLVIMTSCQIGSSFILDIF